MNEATKAIDEARERARFENVLKVQAQFCQKIRDALVDGANSLESAYGPQAGEYLRRLAGEFDYEFRGHLLTHGEMVQAPLLHALTEAAGMGYMMANKMAPIKVNNDTPTKYAGG